ncbi:MAG: RNA polymerase sigma-70 factor [Prevotella sp.]|nr:RNA polymerase sigma-70 factor [Prevotella sp.]MBR5696996.1 RNA polymerase sigma-70 factor [Prevotella sp.]
MQRDYITEKDFEELFRDYYARCYYYAYDILDQEEESRDVVGEAFLSVWKNRENVDRDKLRAYLFTSIRNKCLTQIGKQKHTYRITDEALRHLAAETDEEWLEREERIRQIEHEIELLPARTRLVLEQCYYHHRTYREVAAELGITTDGIKKHITTAMKHLRQHFHKEKPKK